MREDYGILVINRDHRLMAANSLAEFLVGHPLPFDVILDAGEPLADLFARNGYPLDKILVDEQENQGVLKGNQLPEPGLSFTACPFHDESNRVSGAVITLERRTDELPDHALKFLGVSHQELMDCLPEGVFMVNTRWQITYFNKTAQRITGFARREALGKFCWQIFRSDLCHNNCPMRISMSTGEVLLARDVEIMSKSGEKKAIMVNTSQIRKGGKTVLGGLETFHEFNYIQPRATEDADQVHFADIVSVSSKMQEIVQRLPMIAASESNVLIQGESGTGKELVAKALHLHSPKRKGPFIAVNCSAIPENLLESELFGYERGAFTGAVTSKPGRFELARGGTLFLDEIGDLILQLQVKLLRVLEEKMLERVGGTRKTPLEARIIAATNVDLKEAMRQGKFREDLYYRLFTIPIHLPPLRERRDDIPILIKHFLERYNRKSKKQIKGVDSKVMKIFYRHRWPGNIRELQHVLEHCAVFAKGSIITEHHLPQMDSSWTPKWDVEGSPLEIMEKKAIIKALASTSWNKQEAARMLRISRSKLWRKMKAHKITEADFKSEHASQF